MDTLRKNSSGLTVKLEPGTGPAMIYPGNPVQVMARRAGSEGFITSGTPNSKLDCYKAGFYKPYLQSDLI